MSALEKVYNLVKTLNINDNNEEKCYVLSTDFIKELIDFFHNYWEKTSKNTPLSKMYRLRKSATLTRLYGPMYFELDDYPPYSDK